MFLRELRKKMGITQAELANAIGTSPLAVGKWERGENQPSTLLVERLCTFFNVQAEALGVKKCNPLPELALPDIPERLPEAPSTYVVQNRSSEEELSRLSIQDQMITGGMGGVLPEQPDPAQFRRVLDVGCGPGGWLIEAALAYPSISVLVGVDISTKMVTYARQQAYKRGVAGRVEFQIMDALRMLEFPKGFFDVVNQRFGGSFLRTWDWQKLLAEYKRVGKMVRITESRILESNSPALNELWGLLQAALYHAGHFASSTPDGYTKELGPLLQRHGFRQVKTYVYPLRMEARMQDTSSFQAFIEDQMYGFRTVSPFLEKWGQKPAHYEEIYQRMLQEVQTDQFWAEWVIMTFCGKS